MVKHFWQQLILVTVVATLIIGLLLVGCSDSDDTPEATANPTPTLTEEPSNNPTAVIHTNLGDITLELFEDKVPVTVGNFVRLVNDDFYDGMIFQRISDDFMIQGGEQLPDGNKQISPYGPINLEIHPEVRHIDGAISMARTQDPNSATAQFFICDGPQPFLDDGYAAFGVVTEGIEVVSQIAAAPNDGRFEPNPGGGKPIDDVIITSIEIK
jgi:cyclophilin family peptidyl-prolyl cis-trans isomerase